MFADAFTATGSTHIACQDHAAAGVTRSGQPYAIVADGCSSSAHSDYGSRLLVRASELGFTVEGGRWGFAPNLVEVVKRAERLARALRLPDEALDATVLWAYRDGPYVHVMVAGDGVVAVRRASGALEWWSVDYTHGAPCYPSYVTDLDRMVRYVALGGARRVKHYVDGRLLGERVETLDEGPLVWRTTLPARDVALVALLSDGASSFYAADASTTHRGESRVAEADVLSALLAYKSLAGRFVARRCRRFLKRECARRGWRHHDDLGVAAIGWALEEAA